ncbi:hypothetical protein CCC_03330 [Paramagnetospirillum magnetotacticum MS-1]|uniref:Uncharacterized protein n=1 Tax=Paramagnetospirillum magnetotacticum MS-1 TaxID=272627 RepID=A0A0C2UCA8_PARME|nr:hypothetical protein [Paramagnetospirillum magnetotacticum]KIL99112.1 hypothetical protein CCC_03330 [Paramagnetospirillum magnetotacticum MS-1]
MKRAVPLILLLLSSASALAAGAGMEARNYVARRLTAEGHVQVEVTGVEPSGDICRVSGIVRKVFAGRAAAGDSLAFRLPCGADAFWTADKLKAARLAEVFVKPGLNGLDAADDGEGLRLLDAVTALPQSVDDPALVREMTESIARYRIDAEVKRRNPAAALEMTQVADPALRARLLAHAAGLMAAHGLPQADGAADEAIAAVTALPDADTRLETGLVALESLAMGRARKGALALAALLEPEVDALTLPSRRDAAGLVLYGARIRSDDPAGAFVSLSKLSDPATRRDRLSNMPFAQKDFSPVNPDSPVWMDRLLAGAEALPAGSFRTEALTGLCRTVRNTAMEMTKMPDLLGRAGGWAELAARRGHGPSAQLLALIREAQGGVSARAEAARWHAVSATGFDAGPKAKAEALKALGTFTPVERAAAARLIQPMSMGEVSPARLVDLAGR